VNEEILGILSVIWTHAWKPNYHCYLIFTDRRLIVARMGMLRELLPYLFVAVGAGFGAAAGGAAEIGAGAGGATSAATTSPTIAEIDREELKKLEKISPEQVLKSHKNNFYVSYSDIVKAQVGKKLLTTRLYIHTSKEVHKFKFEGPKPEKVESSIRSLLANKIPIERVDKLD
jgi:hypothetical protein